MASDRLVLDVGGTKFITSASTLINNSAYFSSLLSGNWVNQVSDEIFLDRNPAVFAKLLDYMRDNIIKVEDIDVNVLSLAVFLGIEKLLIAIKVRWYNNIGRGEVLEDDEDIAARFDEVYGGILRAISSGLYPYFLRPDDVNAEKDIAQLTLDPQGTLHKLAVQIDEVTKVPKPPVEQCGDGSIVEALNSLYARGYTMHEKQLLSDRNQRGKIFSFSQRKHKTATSSLANDIFILSEDEAIHQQELNYTKQFALIIEDLVIYDSYDVIVGPSEFKQLDPPPQEHRIRQIIDRDEPTCAILPNPDPGWLERNNFLKQEKEYEELFNDYIEYGLLYFFHEGHIHNSKQFRLHSRIVPKLDEDEEGMAEEDEV